MNTNPNVKGFYTGVAACGCERAWLVDDELTTAKEVAEFAKRQAKMKRTMRYADKPQTEVNKDCEEHGHE